MRKILFFMLLFSLVFLAASPVGFAVEAKILDTTAQSAVLMDGTGNILCEKDSHKRLPPASVTKAMTLLLVAEAVEQGRVSLEDKVSTTENAWRQGGS